MRAGREAGRGKPTAPHPAFCILEDGALMLKKRALLGISFKNEGGKALGTLNSMERDQSQTTHPVSLLKGLEHSLDSCHL